jgi:hypothetical protein
VTELLVAAGAGGLWLLLFGAIVSVAVRRLPERGAAPLVAYPIFFALQVLLARGLDALGVLTPAALIMAYAALIAVAALDWLRSAARPLERAANAREDAELVLIRRVVGGTVAAVLIGLAAHALLTPVYVWDVLAYHMAMVASYIQNGSLEVWPTQDLRQIYRVNAGELQMLNVALIARSDVWIELPSLLGLAICLVATYRIGRLAQLPAMWCFAAVALVLTAPQIVVGAGTAKNDLTFTAALLCGFYWFLHAARTNHGGGDAGRPVHLAMMLAGLSAALAAGTKVMGLNIVGALGLLGIVLVAKRALRLRHLVGFAAGTAAALLLIAGDVYLGNLGRTEVPVGVAPGEIHFTFGIANVLYAARYYLYELPFKRLVVPQIFEHDFLHYGYLFPVLIVLAAVTTYRQWRERELVLAALALGAAILFVSVVAFRLPIRWDQRFMIWLVPTLAILAVAAGRGLAARHAVAIASAASAIAVLNVAMTLTNEADGLFNRSALHFAATREPARYLDAPQARYAHKHDGFHALDQAASARDSVLFAGGRNSWMYLAWGPRFSRHVEGVWDAEHASVQVAARTFRFVVIEDAADESIHAALAGVIEAAGYAPLVTASGRTIYVRHRRGPGE